MACPCGTERSVEECCGRFIRGGELPPTAEELMRSRYTAYTLEEVDYILATHDPSSAEDVDRDATEQWAREADWQGLEIVDTVAGGPGDDRGEVEFIARFQVQGKDLTHHERSRFVKLDGRWVYDSGDMIKQKPVVRDKPKVGRNEPCPCGSGKKFKRCCGQAA